jgi:choline monooxygenase
MSDIYNIIDKQKLDIVNKPISEAHGLPNECYISKEYTLIERKKLFEDKWIVISVASSLPNIGDAKPIDLLGMPILVVRTKNNQIKVFHNVCSHRGIKLVREPGKIKNVIRCPYHSWSYNLDGELIATPHIGGMDIHQSPEFKKSKSNLKEIRCYIWLDLIMININNNEISFEEYIKPLSELT